MIVTFIQDCWRAGTQIVGEYGIVKALVWFPWIVFFVLLHHYVEQASRDAEQVAEREAEKWADSPDD